MFYRIIFLFFFFLWRAAAPLRRAQPPVHASQDRSRDPLEGKRISQMTAGVSVRVLFLISNIYYPLHIPAGKIQDRSIHRKCGDVSKAGNRLRSAKVDKSIASAAALVLISPNFPKYRRSSHFLHSNPLLVVLKCFVVLCRL